MFTVLGSSRRESGLNRPYAGHQVLSLRSWCFSWILQQTWRFAKHRTWVYLDCNAAIWWSPGDLQPLVQTGSPEYRPESWCRPDVWLVSSTSTHIRKTGQMSVFQNLVTLLESRQRVKVPIQTILGFIRKSLSIQPMPVLLSGKQTMYRERSIFTVLSFVLVWSSRLPFAPLWRAWRGENLNLIIADQELQ